MRETICNKNTVQDKYGKQQTQQERQDTRDDGGTQDTSEEGNPPTYTVRLYHMGQVDLIECSPQSGWASMRQGVNLTCQPSEADSAQA